MWIISQTGFVSLVQDRKDHSKVWVRARIKEDIAAMFPAYAGEIVTKIGADYIFRLIVPKDVAALAMWNAVQDVDYDSHAKEVMNRRSHPVTGRMGAYYAIWTALAKLQPFAPYAHHPRPLPGMPVHTSVSTAPATGKGYPWNRNPSFSGATGFRNGQALTAADYHGKLDGDWPASDAVDLINDGDDDIIDLTASGATPTDPGQAPDGITQVEWDNMTPDEWAAIDRMDDEEWEAYVAKREAERTGPAKRNPRRKSRAKAPAAAKAAPAPTPQPVAPVPAPAAATAK